MRCVCACVVARRRRRKRRSGCANHRLKVLKLITMKVQFSFQGSFDMLTEKEEKIRNKFHESTEYDGNRMEIYVPHRLT